MWVHESSYHRQQADAVAGNCRSSQQPQVKVFTQKKSLVLCPGVCVSDLGPGKCQERKGDKETMQGGEKNKQCKEDGDLFMRSVTGKEEVKRWGQELQELLKACLPLCWRIRGQDTQPGQCSGNNGICWKAQEIGAQHSSLDVLAD